jgi:hypothetical protein
VLFSEAVDHCVESQVGGEAEVLRFLYNRGQTENTISTLLVVLTPSKSPVKRCFYSYLNLFKITTQEEHGEPCACLAVF